MYVFGGSSVEVEPLNDFFELDTETLTWRDLSLVSKETKPTPRSGNSIFGPISNHLRT